jgi:hypothetical protein
MAITPTYAGPAPGEAGADQINFTLPANVQTGCAVPFQISENGTLSQITFLSIAPTASATACVQPGYTTAQLQAIDNGAPAGYTASFTISQGNSVSSNSGSSISSVITSNAINGFFVQYSGFELLSAMGLGTIDSTPGCTVSPIVQGTPPGPGTLLDAGKVTLTGPVGSNLTSTPIPEVSDG